MAGRRSPKRDQLNRLSRIEYQVRGIATMVKRTRIG
ncbi:Metal-sensitive transcriptional repressor [Sanguibacter gelidistatuariae]|uniref:Metal-sensitive transcriptional repressor n=1 Tax=Sanguibacter gelidistatuariae TaxID=1814289 RepID=A0A1G6SWW4_9MICO|nr:Metal-sensitive transcriptional repressor [Sanguibacter gelidistatuariae]